MSTVLKRILTGIVLGTGFWFLLLYAPALLFSCILLTILAIILMFEWPVLCNIRTCGFWLVMPLYPILPFVLLIALNQQPVYHTLVLMLFVMVSSYDTGGYLIGSLVGRHKIAPSISPHKSWEGFWAGYLFASVSLTLLLYELGAVIYWPAIISITGIVCACACLGDLFESWLKRQAGVKDSGSILPGHGGFLDRFDGILGAAFFFYFFRDTLVALFFA
jgi:phosphatidate cytidylyltransferase